MLCEHGHGIACVSCARDAMRRAGLSRDDAGDVAGLAEERRARLAEALAVLDALDGGLAGVEQALQLVRLALRLVPGLREDARYQEVTRMCGPLVYRAMDHMAGAMGRACERGDITAAVYADWMVCARGLGLLDAEADSDDAESALGPYLCPKCQKRLSPQELDHTMCRACAEKDMGKRLGGGLLELPSDWYDHTPDEAES